MYWTHSPCHPIEGHLEKRHCSGMWLSDHSHKSNHFLQTRVGLGLKMWHKDKIRLQSLNHKLDSVQLQSSICVDVDQVHYESGQLQLSKYCQYRSSSSTTKEFTSEGILVSYHSAVYSTVVCKYTKGGRITSIWSTRWSTYPPRVRCQSKSRRTVGAGISHVNESNTSPSRCTATSVLIRRLIIEKLPNDGCYILTNFITRCFPVSIQGTRSWTTL